MLASAALLHIVCLVVAARGAAPPDKLYTHIEYRLRQLMRPDNSSDAKLLIRDLSTFVRDDGTRRLQRDGARLQRGDARRQRDRTPGLDWSWAGITRWIYRWLYVKRQQAMCDRALDLMRQAMYATQGNINDLAPVLERRNKEPAFRITFVTLRLRQLIIDMRRIYTFAVRWRQKWGTYEQLRWYLYAMSKYLDAIYLVDVIIKVHQDFTRPLRAELGSVLGKNG